MRRLGRVEGGESRDEVVGCLKERRVKVGNEPSSYTRIADKMAAFNKLSVWLLI
jgi:hypothetical protein